MTTRETKILLSGSAMGMLLAVIVLGAYALQATHQHYSATAAPQQNIPAAVQESAGEPAPVQLSQDEINAAGVQTAEVRRGILRTDVDAFGRVEQPETQLAAISARVGGRIDRLHVQFVGQRVRRGQAVADIYSPEVSATVEEYWLALENKEHLRVSGNEEVVQQAAGLVEASRRRLELWGVSAAQIETLPASGSTPHITMYSPSSGTVVERKVTQGQYVSAGETLFTVADLSTVWVKCDVYESQLPEIRAGQAVELASESVPGEIIRGRVEFIEPSANPQTRTVPVHVHVSNPGMRLLPGMFVRARFISFGKRDSLLVPRSAVLDTGTRRMVYVSKANGVFEGRTVELGSPSEDSYPVLKGLEEGERVVTSGNFLIDSQTRLSSGMSGLFGGSREFRESPQGGQLAAATGYVSINLAVDPDPPKGGADNSFRVGVTDVSGKPLSGATVTVMLVMPAMPAMNMPEMRSSSTLAWDAAHNSYVGRVNVPTAGAWTVTIEVLKDGRVVGTHRARIRATS